MYDRKNHSIQPPVDYLSFMVIAPVEDAMLSAITALSSVISSEAGVREIGPSFPIRAWTSVCPSMVLIQVGGWTSSSSELSGTQ